jgi:hypothetical protein
MGHLRPAGGQVEITIDDQDLGTLAAGSPLSACFVVGNKGQDRLLLRQTPIESRDTWPEPNPTYTVSPGQKVAITARLAADELAPQGVTHILFMTSDPACPRLWLTVRGTVQNR